MASGFKRILIQSPAGSGKSVTMAEITKQTTDKGNRVLFVVHRKELVAQIKQTFKTHGVDESLCEIAMVQTISRRLKEVKKPSLIIVDEAHHSLAKTYRKIFDHFNDSFLIGCTATPIRLNGDGLGEVFELMIQGEPIKWLIDNGFLAPFDYYSIDLTNHEKLKKSSVGDYTYDSMTDALGDTIFGDVVKHYRILANDQKAIVYCHNVEMSKRIASQFNSAGITAKQVDGKTPKLEREQAMDDFVSGKIKILTNAELYGEGVDVPDCSVVILLRPTESLSLYIQQSMRPMRYRPNKRATIIDHVGNVYRHGFPDMERSWTLEKKKRKRKEEEAYPILTCDVASGGCGMVYPKDDIEMHVEDKIRWWECSNCGHINKTEMNSDKKVVDIDLKKIEREDIQKQFYKNRNWRQATSYKELQEIGKAKGYKPSWSAFKAKELNLPDAPAWVYRYRPKNKGFNLNVQSSRI